MSIRIRVYPQPNSVGARRQRAIRRQQRRLRRLRRQQRQLQRQAALAQAWAYPGSYGAALLPFTAPGPAWPGPYGVSAAGFALPGFAPLPSAFASASAGEAWLGWSSPFARLGRWAGLAG